LGGQGISAGSERREVAVVFAKSWDETDSPSLWACGFGFEIGAMLVFGLGAN
jgi:hypothetical protein